MQKKAETDYEWFLKQLGILTANPRVERVVLFGSRAMGTHTPESDIDLAL